MLLAVVVCGLFVSLLARQFVNCVCVCVCESECVCVCVCLCVRVYLTAFDGLCLHTSNRCTRERAGNGALLLSMRAALIVACLCCCFCLPYDFVCHAPCLCACLLVCLCACLFA